MSRILSVLCLLSISTFAGADVWDIQSNNDNTTASKNELVHGSDQLHDLAPLAGPTSDVDWSPIRQQPYSSYEIVIDATSGDIAPTLKLERLATAGTITTLLQSSVATGMGFSRSLRFRNTTGSPIDSELVRVTSTAPPSSCGPDDVYRIRAYDTTYAIARFNNSGTQVTNVVLQNTTTAGVDVTLYFWDGSGALLYTYALPAPLAAKEVKVINTSAFTPPPSPPLTSGSITVSNSAPYGRLNGKAVSAETSTGFTFDTVMTPVVH